MKKLCAFLCLMCLTAALTVPASAAGPLEYSIDAPGDPDYGTPTSFEPVITADGGARKNEDVSKNAALIPPPWIRYRQRRYPEHGTPLTPNLAPGSIARHRRGGQRHLRPGLCPRKYDPTVNTPADPETSAPSTGYTEVTSDLYYSGGHLGTLKIPAIGLTVKVYEGTDSKTLAKGAGHFEETSIWRGNIAVAAAQQGHQQPLWEDPYPGTGGRDHADHQAGDPHL